MNTVDQSKLTGDILYYNVADIIKYLVKTIEKIEKQYKALHEDNTEIISTQRVKRYHYITEATRYLFEFNELQRRKLIQDHKQEFNNLSWFERIIGWRKSKEQIQQIKQNEYVKIENNRLTGNHKDFTQWLELKYGITYVSYTVNIVIFKNLSVGSNNTVYMDILSYLKYWLDQCYCCSTNIINEELCSRRMFCCVYPVVKNVNIDEIDMNNNLVIYH